MFKTVATFSSFSVKNLAEAKKFYGETLGLTVKEEDMGLRLHLQGGGQIFVYPKDNHEPATFTILNVVVADIDEAVDELTSRGVSFERYEGEYQADDKGIVRSNDPKHGPSIGWFKDPAGNILSVIEDSSK